MSQQTRAHKKYLEIWQLGKAFFTPDRLLPVVENFNLSVEQGEFVVPEIASPIYKQSFCPWLDESVSAQRLFGRRGRVP